MIKRILRRRPRLTKARWFVLVFVCLIGFQGCSHVLPDFERYSGGTVVKSRRFSVPFSEGKYDEVIERASRHLKRDDPLYREAVYFMYRARLAQLQEQERQAEHARKLKEREAAIDIDEKATAPKEGPPRNRSAIQRESGFIEPPFPPEFPKDPSLLEKLNRKIPSLNIIDGEVEFILYDLFKDTGINIISDPGLLKGKKISLRLQDETILNILKYMAENQGFDFAIRDNTLWLTVPKKEQLTTRVFRLKHGLTASRLTRDFESLADLSFLNQATQQQGGAGSVGGQGTIPQGGEGDIVGQRASTKEKEILSALELFLENFPKLVEWPEGSQLFIDKKKNLVVIRSTPSTLTEAGKLLEEFDINPIQVLIETRFIEVSDLDLFDFGVDFNAAERPGDTTPNKGGTFFDVPLVPPPVPPGGTNVLLTGVMSGSRFQAAIFVLDRLETSNTLSSPRVTTSNNSMATLAVVTNLVFIEDFQVEFPQTPIVPGTVGGQQVVVNPIPTLVATVNDRNFTGIVLNVTPSVGADGKTITLTLQPVVRAKVDEIVLQNTAVIPIPGGGQLISPAIIRPIIETRFVNTQLTIEDHSTVVMGGLSTLIEKKIENKVPYLGDIPFLGRLFRRDIRSTDKKNLMIFVTTRILNEEGGRYTDGESSE
ncbi:MAG: hypothetical protein EPO39_16970 [Candidatus Manganitrophaceae bacterium]|nr:MAG: hypothetical protein EPO39_16970 [Candidatus Manganitrophaceae bacterium]